MGTLQSLKDLTQTLSVTIGLGLLASLSSCGNPISPQITVQPGEKAGGGANAVAENDAATGSSTCSKANCPASAISIDVTGTQTGGTLSAAAGAPVNWSFTGRAADSSRQIGVRVYQRPSDMNQSGDGTSQVSIVWTPAAAQQPTVGLLVIARDLTRCEALSQSPANCTNFDSTLVNSMSSFQVSQTVNWVVGAGANLANQGLNSLSNPYPSNLQPGGYTPSPLSGGLLGGGGSSGGLLGSLLGGLLGGGSNGGLLGGGSNGGLSGGNGYNGSPYNGGGYPTN